MYKNISSIQRDKKWKERKKRQIGNNNMINLKPKNISNLNKIP